ncbi:LysE family translocator [Luteolibacter luteus]|uniref:LysE family translocator n=1 Tax=Luteolibacter luteus TaxID=2728835 RepID=A0A858RJA6_9BACT|nr:LysE family translocator [Luteolibacter luteus]QJE96805.1 LysE family translocator [Luteolibacter luteus]
MNLALELAAFAGVMALGQFSPGPDMVLLTRTALSQGAKAGAIMACGISSGLAIHMTFAAGGLALALERLPALNKAITWAAAAYLLWLAYGIAKAHLAPKVAGTAGEVPEAKGGNPYLRGFICNLLNPKVMVILAAVCAPFLKGEHPGWWPFALWALVVVQGGVLWSIWAWLLQWPPLRLRYERSAKWIDIAFSLTLAALALKLILMV